MAQIVMNPVRPALPMLIALCALLGALVCGGCSKSSAIVDGKTDVEIDGRVFSCVIVADNATRTVGLGNHPGLGEHEGMLFSFPDAQVRRFLMRDCTFPIDVIFLDPSGRITAMHHMPVEAPRRDDETAYQYDLRLTKYSSRFNAQYAIELLGGTLEQLGLSNGDLIELDTEALQGITE